MWEYKTITVPFGRQCTERLNAEMYKLGVLNWELVSVGRCDDWWRLFFKRKVLDEEK